MRILSGIQPSGTIHIGNYFGMMKPAMELSRKGDAFLFIADYHALTVLPEPAQLRERVRNVAVDFIACGLTEDTIFFKQSDIRAIPELTWLLSCVTPMGLLERCHSYKDKIAHGMSPNHGLFAYPVLMASDILIYKSNIVPVGKDQKQHVEVARDIAQRFNNKYGENILVIPEPQIRDDVAVVPGTDGQKMSKSYGNTIELFGPEKEIKKKFMGIKTDSTPLEEPKDPEKCPVFALYKLFASKDQLETMEANYRRGGYGYGHAKKELFEVFWEHFRPYRLRRDELLKDMSYVDSFLKKGAEKANAVAEATMKQVRESVGL